MTFHFANLTAIFFAVAMMWADEPIRLQAGSPDAAAKPDSAKLPQIDPDGAMHVPKNYREWVFVGSSIGLGYKETKAPRLDAFNHIYIDPIAYRAFRETGKFPIGTVLMLERVSAGQKTNPALTGYYSNKFIGLEAAVKTGDRFRDPWTYYNFFSDDGKQLSKARPITATTCIACHKLHAETDHVFTQFYPVLRSIKPKK